jgi:hypothetical protein
MVAVTCGERQRRQFGDIMSWLLWANCLLRGHSSSSSSSGVDEGWLEAAPDLLSLANQRGLTLSSGGRCDIYTVAADATDQLRCGPGDDCAAFDALIARREPFLLRGYAAGWRAQELWSREYLYRVHGSSQLSPGLASQKASYESFGLSANVKGEESSAVGRTLAGYLDQMREGLDANGCPASGADGNGSSTYLFDNGASTVAKQLLPEAGNPPAFAERLGMEELTLTLAPSGVGFPLHSHGRSWIGLVRGVKLWAFYDPESLPATTEAEAMVVLPPLRWMREYGGGADKGHLQWCVQQPGDLLFVPDYWHHWTLNLGETLGFGAQRNAISNDDVEALHFAHPASGRANFELVGRILAGEIQDRGQMQQQVRGTGSTRKGVSAERLLTIAAEYEPWELSFSLQLLNMLLTPSSPSHTQSHKLSKASRKRGLKLARKVRARLKGSVKKGWTAPPRIAWPLAVLGHQLIKLSAAEASDGDQHAVAACAAGRQWLQEAVDIDPKMGFGWFSLAMSYSEIGAMVPARAAAARAVAVEDSPAVHNALGRAGLL